MVEEYGYEYDTVLNEEIWENTKGITTKEKLWDAYCLRSGRDALKAIAREYEPCVALLPALACESMIHPFERYGHIIQFYRLNADYSIDISSLKVNEGLSLFVYIDYFGKQAISDDNLNSLREKGNIIFIEDRTHNLLYSRTATFQPDYIIASLRKWIAIPDGGLLWGKIVSPLSNDTSFSTIRLRAQCMRNEYIKSGDEKIKTAFREIFSTVSDIMDNDEPSAMSAYAYALAKHTNWEQLKTIRKNNADTLISVLRTSPYISLIQDKTGVSDLYVAFTVKNRDKIQRELAALGVFNTIIWPLKDSQKTTCEIAKYTEEHMLAAPCDQRYSTEDMQYIGDAIVRVVANVNG